MEWIIAKHNSAFDGTLLDKVEGSPAAVRKLLVRMVNEDRAHEAADGDNSWDLGTENEEDVLELAEATLYAVGCYNDFHIDYTAKPLEFMDLHVLDDTGHFIIR